MGRLNGRLYSDFLESGVLDSVVTNALFICRVEKGVETSVYITEFAVIRILDTYTYDCEKVSELYSIFSQIPLTVMAV